MLSNEYVFANLVLIVHVVLFINQLFIIKKFLT